MFGAICNVRVSKILITMNHKISLLVILTCSILGISLGFAQQSSTTLNTDSLLQEAMVARQQQNWRKAITLSKQAIAVAPTYYDFHILLGSVYNAIQQPDSALFYFNIAKQHPSYTSDAEVGILNAQALKEELSRVERKIFADPNRYLQGSKELLNRIGIQYMPTLSDHSDVHLWSLEYMRRSPKIKNTWIARLNYGRRNSLEGVQLDIEDYLVHSDRNYSMFNVAVSPSKILPEMRLGYSLYTGFHNAWEMETGLRFTRSEGNNIYTVLIGGSKEIGNNWLNLKNYITKDDTKYFASHLFTWRHYLNERQDYFTLIAGIGMSPDNKNYQFSTSGYKDKSIGAGYQGQVSRNFLIGLTGVYNKMYVSTNYRNRYDLYASVFYLF